MSDANGSITNPTKADDDGQLEGRRSDGTFAPGNKIGRGNPNYAHINRLRQEFITEALRQLPGESEGGQRTRMGAVVRAMFTKAIEGDVHAARFCAEYSIGRPQQAITIEGPEGPRFKVFCDLPDTALHAEQAPQLDDFQDDDEQSSQSERDDGVQVDSYIETEGNHDGGHQR